MTRRLRLFAAACLASGAAFAQLGPIEPIIIASSKPSEALADIPDTKNDYLVPFEATVAPDGTVSDVVVTTPSGEAAVDATVVRFIKEKTFLPALDVEGQPMTGKVAGTVEFKSSTINKQLKANVKPPNTQNEVARVRKLTCKDFTWEIERLRGEGRSTDLSREIMPWVSLRVYLLDRKLPPESESKLMPRWPRVLDDGIRGCKAAPDRAWLADVLTPLLDKAGS